MTAWAAALLGLLLGLALGVVGTVLYLRRRCGRVLWDSVLRRLGRSVDVDEGWMTEDR